MNEDKLWTTLECLNKSHFILIVKRRLQYDNDNGNTLFALRPPAYATYKYIHIYKYMITYENCGYLSIIVLINVFIKCN